MKANYDPSGSLLKLRWNRGAFELLAGSLPPDAKPGQFPTLEGSAEDAVISALLSHAGERLVLQKPNSPYFAPKKLKRLAPDILAGFSQSEIAAALVRLEKREVIRPEVVGRDSSYREIWGLVVLPDKIRSASIFD